MFVVPGLENVECAWFYIQACGFTLHGFLLFLPSDHFFPQFLEDGGLEDLDQWSAGDCAIFVVQSPSARWIEYTQATGHHWWTIFGSHLKNGSEDLIRQYDDSPVIEINGSRKTLREVFAPPLNWIHQRQEIKRILHRFNLKPTDHPCLVLFKDLQDSSIWHVDLKDLVDIPPRDLRRKLQDWFSGPDFRRLLREA